MPCWPDTGQAIEGWTVHGETAERNEAGTARVHGPKLLVTCLNFVRFRRICSCGAWCKAEEAGGFCGILDQAIELFATDRAVFLHI